MAFFPKTVDFFALLYDLAQITHVTAKLLDRKTQKKRKKTNHIALKARQLELTADEICHHIREEVNLTFITPIDREDIYKLADRLDTVVDLIEDLIAKDAIFALKTKTKEYDSFIRLIQSVTAEIVTLMDNMRQRDKKVGRIKKMTIRINDLENKGDELLRQSYILLFSRKMSPITLVKWKDMYTTAEAVLDESEAFAELIEEVMIKNY